MNEPNENPVAGGCCPPATCSAIHGATYHELDEANAKLCAENATLRALTADDVTAAENKGYDHGRRHGQEECLEELRRLRDAAWSIIKHRHVAEEWQWENLANAVNAFDAKDQRLRSPNAGDQPPARKPGAEME